MSPDVKRELSKVFDVVEKAREFHQRRDEMNAAVHMAGTIRYSPLTTELDASLDTLKRLLES